MQHAQNSAVNDIIKKRKSSMSVEDFQKSIEKIKGIYDCLRFRGMFYLKPLKRNSICHQDNAL